MGRAINEILMGDRRRRTEEAGKEVERLLVSDPLLHREAWHWMKGWYWAVVDRVPPPAWVTLERIMAEQVDLYCYKPSPGENIPISIEPFSVEDLVPTEEDIKWVVKQLCNHLYRGASGMRAEHIKG